MNAKLIESQTHIVHAKFIILRNPRDELHHLSKVVNDPIEIHQFPNPIVVREESLEEGEEEEEEERMEQRNTSNKNIIIAQYFFCSPHYRPDYINIIRVLFIYLFLMFAKRQFPIRKFTNQQLVSCVACVYDFSAPFDPVLKYAYSNSKYTYTFERMSALYSIDQFFGGTV